MTKMTLNGARTMMKSAFRILFALSIVLVPCIGAQGAVVYVNHLAGGFNDGSTWGNAYTTLGPAITASTSGDEIWVAAGTYKPGSLQSDAFSPKQGVAIYGGFAGGETLLSQRDFVTNVTILSGDVNGDDGPTWTSRTDNNYHVLTYSNVDRTTILDGFRITAGSATSTVFPDNSGGGIFCSSNGSPNIRNCTFYKNDAGSSGGGVFVEANWNLSNYSAPLFTNCRFFGNYASFNGGGAFIGLYGGGTAPGATDNNQTTFRNCHISGNQAAQDGGGVHIYGGEPRFRNCSVLRNTAGQWGGGFFIYFVQTDRNPVVSNTLIWGNADNHGTEEAGAMWFYFKNMPLNASYCLIQGYTESGIGGTGNFTGDPKLWGEVGPDGTPGTPDDSCQILAGSACIDAGRNSDVPGDVTTDIDGLPRFRNIPETGDTGIGTAPIVDVGASEFFGTRIYVDASSAATGADGLSWESAYPDLATPLHYLHLLGDVDAEIWVADGNYTPADRNNIFLVPNGLNLYGGFAGPNTPGLLNGETSKDQRRPGLYESVLNGDLNGDDGADFTNYGENSRGVLGYENITDSLELDGFTIRGGNQNSLYHGGGGVYWYESTSSLSITNCRIIENIASSSGGGLYANRGSIYCASSTLRDNRSNGHGGGAYFGTSVSSAVWVNCKAQRNMTGPALYGGGLYSGGDLTLINSIFSGNSAYDGGALYFRSIRPQILNCVLNNNYLYNVVPGDTRSGGIFWDMYMTVKNSIIWGNDGKQIYDGLTPTVTYSCVQQPVSGAGNINSDPMFVDHDGSDGIVGTDDDNLRLQKTSPCVDAGSNTALASFSVLTMDLDNKIRKMDIIEVTDTGEGATPIVDMGPYEAVPTRLYVDAGASPGGDGSSWAMALQDLQVAVFACSVDDESHEIWVAGGTYHPDKGTGDPSMSFELVSGLKVYGGFEGIDSEKYPGGESDLSQRDFRENRTILSGNIGTERTHHIVVGYDLSSDTVLDGFTIRGGQADLSIDDVPGYGAGLYLSNSQLLLTNCRIIANRAYKGGGLFLDNACASKILNCEFFGNYAAYSGGGAFNRGNSDSEYINCLFSGNQGDNAGGGMNNRYSNPRVVNCTFYGNGKSDGTVCNGGGMNNYNCSPVIVNSILWGNGGGEGLINQLSGTYQPLRFCCIQGLTIQGDGNCSIDPSFLDPDGPDNVLGTGDDNLRYRRYLPIVDWGLNSENSEPLDLDGNPRIRTMTRHIGDQTVNPVIDMGPYEVLPHVLYVDENSITPHDGQRWTTAFTELQTPLGMCRRSVGTDTQIWIADGTYCPDNGSGRRIDAFELIDGVSILGGFDGYLFSYRATGEVSPLERYLTPNATILSGEIGAAGTSDNSYHVVLSDGNNETAVLDTITIDSGNADGDPSKNRDGGGGILIKSGNPAVQECTFSNNTTASKGGAVYVKSAEPTFTGCTFTENSSPTTGGAFYQTGNSLSLLTECTFLNNSAGTDPGLLAAELKEKPKIRDYKFSVAAASGLGGAIYNDASTLVLSDCTLRSNSAGDAGAGLYNTNAAADIRGCIFRTNETASVGGAIYNDSDDLVIYDTVFIKNRTLLQGGGIYTTYCAPKLDRLSFVANSSYLMGGGIYNDGGQFNISNTVFNANSSDAGGGLCNTYSGRLTFYNCTFHGNWVSGLGGGLSSGDTSSATLNNCILWGNSDSVGNGESSQIHQTTRTPFLYSCCVQGWTGTLSGGNSCGDNPLFRDTDGSDNVAGNLDDDFRLQSGSPCIDRGNSGRLAADSVDADQDADTTEPAPWDAMGFRRLVDETNIADTGIGTSPIVDIGAYEFQMDCNGNDYPDYLDIAEGTSADCNLNEIPDECELTAQPVMYVDADATGANTGASWTDAFVDLQSALEFARGAGQGTVAQIWVANGDYNPDRGTGERTRSFGLISGVALFGGFAGADSVNYPGGESALFQRDLVNNRSRLSGDIGIENSRDDDSYHVVTYTGANRSASMDGFVILKGNADGADDNGRGGGIWLDGGAPTITNCFVLDCRAKEGAGIYVDTGSPALQNCMIRNCHASVDGGALMSSGSGTFALSNCTIISNSGANTCGGVYSTNGSSIYLLNCILWNNTGGAATLEKRQVNTASGSVSLDYCCVEGFRGTLPSTECFGQNPDFEIDGYTISFNSPCVDRGNTFSLQQDYYDLDGDGDSSEYMPFDIKGYRRLLDNAHAPDIGSGTPVVDIGAVEAHSDCNGNGIPDYLDVDSGVSEDADGDGILDECETIIYVDADASGANDGTSWYDAYTSLTDAIATAASDASLQEIWVANGTYIPSGDRTSSFVLADGIGIYGGFAGADSSAYYNGEWERDQRMPSVNEAILSGDLNGDDNSGGDSSENCYHVVTTQTVGTTTTLDGFTITGGNANGLPVDGNNNGAGMLLKNASPNLVNLLFSKNAASGSGGGLCIQGTSEPAVSNCTFVANTAGLNGGGVYNLSNPSFMNCRFLGNTASGFGGGLINQGGTVDVLGCLFSGNSVAGSGAGVYNSNSSTVGFVNCTFGNNNANQQGGGVANVLSTVTINNSILWDNTDGSGTTTTPQMFTQGGTVQINYSCIESWTGGGTMNQTVDPLFVDALGLDNVSGTLDDDLRLISGSTCLDAGNNSVLPPDYTTDLDGGARRQDEPCARKTGNGTSPVVDMGAYEHFYDSVYTDKIVYVKAGASGSNDGTSWTDAFKDLQDALDQARICEWIDEIWVAAGSYRPDRGTNNRTLSFELVDHVALYGGFLGTETNRDDRDWFMYKSVLTGAIGTSSDSDNSQVIVKTVNNDYRALLDGFTITKAFSTALGTGMQMQDSSAVVKNCTFIGNVGASGGAGMRCAGGYSYSANCFFVQNTSTGPGAGVLNTNNCTGRFVNCVFTGNYGAGVPGAGMYNDSSSVTVLNCTFYANKSMTGPTPISGSGMTSSGCTPEVINSILINNGGSTQTLQVSGNHAFSYSCVQGWTGSYGGQANGDSTWVSFVDADGADNTQGTLDDDLRLTGDCRAIDSGDGTQYAQCVADQEGVTYRCSETDIAGEPRFGNGMCAFDTGLRRSVDEDVIDRGAYEVNETTCSYPQRLYVNASATGSDDGRSWQNAYTDLQDALSDASACAYVEEIWVADGTYYPDGESGNRSSTFTIRTGLQVYGGFAGGESSLNERDWETNVTVLSGDLEENDFLPYGNYGDNSYHIVKAVDADDARLDGFTISHGSASDVGTTGKQGGALLIQNSDLTVANCLIDRNNYGAVHQLGGHPIFDNCRFVNNNLPDNLDGAAIKINTTGADTYAEFFHCDFLNNVASEAGGAISAGNISGVNLEACTLIGNTSGYQGGAVYLNTNGVSWITNTVVAGNRSGGEGEGGGIYAVGGTQNLVNCTFWKNYCPYSAAQGAGFRSYGTATVQNSIFWANYNSLNETQLTQVQASSLTIQRSVIHHRGTDLDIDPMFVDANGADDIVGTPDDNLRLQSGSHCLDGGRNSYVTSWMLNDPDGNPRVQDEPCTFDTGVGTAPYVDIGAYEHNYGIPPSPIYVDANANGLDDGSSWEDAYTELSDALNAANNCACIEEIWVAAGTYKPDSGSDRTKSFEISGAYSVYGGFGGLYSALYPGGETELAQRDWRANRTILSGDVGTPGSSVDNSYHVVSFNGTQGSCMLSGLVIQDGNANGSAAAGYDRGGGVYAVDSDSMFVNCILKNNKATATGGGIYLSQGTCYVINSFFGGNSANTGGGLCQEWTGLYITNSVFSGNGAALGGGLANTSGGVPLLVNCTFYGNTATSSGGGIYKATTGVGRIENSLFWANADSGGSDQSAQIHLAAASPNPNINFSCVQGWTGSFGGTANISSDPFIISPRGPDDVLGTEDDDLCPGPLSPCIDAGDTSELMQDMYDFDQDGDVTEKISQDFAGFERLLDDPLVADTGLGSPAVVDIGAFEAFMDCNDNGTPDYVELAENPGLDSDGNGMLDECNTFVGDELLPPLAGADPSIIPSISNSNLAFVHPSDGKVYAKAPGSVSVSWGKAGVPDVIKGTYIIQITPGTVTAYITNAPYNSPKIDLDAVMKGTPAVDVIFHYNATIQDDPAPADPLINADAYIDVINKLNVEKTGQILLEYRDRETGEMIDLEILDIKKPIPVISPGIDVGTELLPSSPEKQGTGCVPQVTIGLIGTKPYVYQQGESQPGPTQYKVYAIRPTNGSPNFIELYWYALGKLDVQWPSEVHRYITQWPASPQVNLRGSAAHPTVDLSAHYQATVAYQYPDNHATIANRKFSTSSAGRATILYSEQIPQGTSISFEIVQTIEHDDLVTTEPQLIGDRIESGDHDYECFPCGFIYSGTPYDPLIYQAGVFEDISTWDGLDRAIIPVNKGDIEVWWYRKSQDVSWPYKPVVYQCDWPTVPDDCIIIANGKGIPGFPEAKYLNPLIYSKGSVTTNRNAVGYNPNEEHAEWIQAPGENLHASRDDLNIVHGCSEPFVLIRYQDNSKPEKAWEFDVIGVVPEAPMGQTVSGCACAEEPCTFVYSTTAGYSLTPPIPLLFHLPYCDMSTIIETPVENYFWDDQKGRLWFRRGDTKVTARFWENWEGVCSPWLDYGSGVPQDVTYDLKWPSRAADAQNPPGSPNTYTPLSFGETRDRTGYGVAELLYNDCGASLIMPWKTSFVNLAATDVPDDYITLHGSLPPHIGPRLSYDDINQVLIFKGISGDGLLGIMSETDCSIIKQAFSGHTNFCNAVDSLYAMSQQSDAKAVGTQVGMENPNWGIAISSGSATKPGWVVVGYNGHPDVAEPVEVEIFYVGCPPEQGSIQVIYPDCPFTEQLTLRWSGDCGGDCQNMEFKWIFCEGANPPDFDDINININPDAPPQGVSWKRWTDGGDAADPNAGWVRGQNEIIISAETASGLFALTDNWFQVKTRIPLSPPPGATYPCAPGTESEWTNRQLAEGWLKRVKRAINPFDQRVREFTNDRVASYVGMIEQFGTPYTDRIPLTCNSEILNRLGLIEMYQACLLRGKSFSIDSSPQPVNYPPANQALLMMAGNLADFHMLLGNEAYGDAQDPTIGIGVDLNEAAASMFCFQDQLPTNENSLLFEELAMLRGRDGRDGTRTDQFPVYNRLYWNFTSGDGQVAYVNNYNIQDFYPDYGDARGDGILNEYDAATMFPQGHGDAWGHYLSAMRFYYDLMRHPYFSWQIRSEAVLVNQQPVMISYAHERKFTKAAAAKAQAGLEITNLTYREQYTEDPSKQWKGYPDAAERDWGVTDWGRRAFMGAYFDWALANSILPASDEVHPPESLEKVDRTTVPALRNIATAADQIQIQIDQADAGVNPMGLPKNVVPFDINPSQLDPERVGGAITHFEQVYQKAVGVLNNTVDVFNHANQAAQRLRENQDDAAAWENNIEDGEWDYTCRLIEIFGYPYPEDKDPFTGATYGFDYVGPDLYHWGYVDVEDLIGLDLPEGDTVTLTFTSIDANEIAGGVQSSTSTATVDFRVVPGFGTVKPKDFNYDRHAPGEIQMARSSLLQEWWRFKKATDEYDNAIKDIEDQIDLIESLMNLKAEEIRLKENNRNTVIGLNVAMLVANSLKLTFYRAANLTDSTANSLAEALPKVLGFSCDATSVARAAAQIGGGVASNALNILGDIAEGTVYGLERGKEIAALQLDIDLATAQKEQANHAEVVKLKEMIRKMYGKQLELYSIQESIRQASGRYQQVISKGALLLAERTAYRQSIAEQISKYRYKDMAFRVFRNDALQKYRAQFDLTARYAYMAVKAYGYETNLLDFNSLSGERILTKLVRERTLGQVNNGVPEAGVGLAGLLAELNGNFQSIKGSLGFSTGITATDKFSIRREYYRIHPGDVTGEEKWREALTRAVVRDLRTEIPEFRQYCSSFEPYRAFDPSDPLNSGEPAIVIDIPEGTTIKADRNFFGWPGATDGGESFYPSDYYSIKIRGVGLWFSHYSDGTGGLTTTPRCYLVPIGCDVSRVPFSENADGARKIREWKVVEQVLPMPFDLGEAMFATRQNGWIPADQLSGNLLSPRLKAYPSIRAYHDGGEGLGSIAESEFDMTSYLVGRSVWNTRWMLIIPGRFLLQGDPNEGVRRFIEGADGNGGVTDVRLAFKTYQYSGAGGAADQIAVLVPEGEGR